MSRPRSAVRRDLRASARATVPRASHGDRRCGRGLDRPGATRVRRGQRADRPPHPTTGAASARGHRRIVEPRRRLATDERRTGRWDSSWRSPSTGRMTPRRRSSSIRSVEHAGKIGLEDTAVVRKDADGKVTIHNEASSGTETGAVVGAVLGGLLFVVFPVGAIVGGAVVGGLVGRALAPGIDGKFVKEVGEDLPPGGSALFLLVKDGDPGLLVGVLGAVPRSRPPDLVRRRHRAGHRRRACADRRDGVAAATIGVPWPTDALLPDHVDRVRQQQAGPAHPVRGHRRGRDRALASDARRRHAVPDRHRRALDQHRPGRGRRGPPDARVRRREGRAVPGGRGRPGDHPRPVHPDDRPGPRPRRAGDGPPRPRQRRHLPRHVRGLVLPERGLPQRDRRRSRRRAARSARTIPTSRSSG